MPSVLEGNSTHLPPPDHQRFIRNCWATTAAGKPCPGAVKDFGRKEVGKGAVSWNYVPYCKNCMKHGDAAVKAIPHPTIPQVGNILIAARDLPVGYRFVYWGTRTVESGDNKNFMEEDDRAIDFTYGYKKCGLINPGPHKGAVLQFAATPGPNERYNMVCSEHHFGMYNDEIVGRLYTLVRPVLKNHQICHEYGRGWLEERGIKPCNMGTPEYPITRKLCDMSLGPIFQTQTGKFVAKVNTAEKGQKKVLQYVGRYDSEEEAMRFQAFAALAIETAREAKAAKKSRKATPATPKTAMKATKRRSSVTPVKSTTKKVASASKKVSATKRRSSVAPTIAKRTRA